VRSKQAQSFDHLVGKHLQVQRHVEIKRFRGFEIYHQLKLGRLLDLFLTAIACCAGG
jgi:hypothetical protein